MIDPSDKNIYGPYIEVVDYALDRMIEEGKEPVLLDAGCGKGTILEEQYKKCKKVIGVDKDRIGLNKNRLVDQKIFSDLAEIPLPDDSVDIITSAWVLEHIKSPKKFAKECDRLLKPGGYFAFIAPNKDGWYAVLSESMSFMIQKKAANSLYNRGDETKFPTYYKMNSEEDLDNIFRKGRGYRKVQFVYNDDPKYIGFNILFKPFAWLWHKVVMLRQMRKERVHIIGLYKKM